MEFGKEEDHYQERKQTQAPHSVEIGVDAEILLQDAPHKRTKAETCIQSYVETPHIITFVLFGGKLTDICHGYRHSHSSGKPLYQPHRSQFPHISRDYKSEGYYRIEKKPQGDEYPPPLSV